MMFNNTDFYQKTLRTQVPTGLPYSDERILVKILQKEHRFTYLDNKCLIKISF